MSRNDVLLAGLTRADRLIEIGASHSPLVPKRDGWKTTIVDHTTRSGLIAKYNYDPATIEIVEDVDVVWAGGALHHSFPANLHGGYDAILASHVLEHLPDPISFLQSCQTLLRAGGTLILALPDKRRCFDLFGALTTAGEWLENHLDKRIAHPPRVAWNEAAYAVRSDGAISWPTERFGRVTFVHPFDVARGVAIRSHTTPNEYFDFHASRFIPPSFALIMLELLHAGYVTLELQFMSELHGHEFFVHLTNGAATSIISPEQLAVERMRLLKACLHEMTQVGPTPDQTVSIA